jgi:hypothetical protein
MAPGVPLFPPILPPVFYPGTPENTALGRDLTNFINWISGLYGPDDPTDANQWQKWPKERDNRLQNETCSLTETPWQGPGKGFDPNEPPEGPWWKKAVYSIGRIIKLIKGWPD